MSWLKKSKVFLIVILLVLVLIPVLLPLIHPGFPVTDDGNWMIIRFSAFYQAFREGQIPARFLGRLNSGYGYPVANFLYPGFMYMGLPLKVAGLSFVNVVKIILGISLISSGVFIFLWLSKLFDDISAFFASVFYVYLPYHIYDFSKRGSVGEVLSLSVFPFLMWQIEIGNVFFASLGLAFLLVSHNTLALLFFGVALSYMCLCLYFAKKKKILFNHYLKIILFGFGISAFFWIPAVFELTNTVFFKTKVSNPFGYFADYNLIGITALAVIVLTIMVLIWKRKDLSKHRITLLMLLLSIISVFLASNLSSFIWKIIPVSFIQFPFRMLSVSIVTVSFLAAFVLSQIPTKFRILLGLILIIVTVYFSKNYILISTFNLQDDSFYSTNEATTTVADEYMPIWVGTKPIGHPADKVAIVKGEGVVDNITYNSKRISFDYKSSSPSVVRINTIYYPGWQAYANRKEKAIFYDNKAGVMELKLEQGLSHVNLLFGETGLRMLADVISALSLLGLLLTVFKKQIDRLLKI